jgi:hypothetical protein
MHILDDDDPTPAIGGPLPLDTGAEVTSTVTYMDSVETDEEVAPFDARGPVTIDTGGGEKPLALVFASRSGGKPHVVIVLDLEVPSVACTCKAMRSIGYRPQGCHAMQAARTLLGISGV